MATFIMGLFVGIAACIALLVIVGGGQY